MYDFSITEMLAFSMFLRERGYVTEPGRSPDEVMRVRREDGRVMSFWITNVNVEMDGGGQVQRASTPRVHSPLDADANELIRNYNMAPSPFPWIDDYRPLFNLAVSDLSRYNSPDQLARLYSAAMTLFQLEMSGPQNYDWSTWNRALKCSLEMANAARCALLNYRRGYDHVQ